MRRTHRNRAWDAWLIGLIAAAAIGWGTGLREPPRFDGAGYAVLGWSLASGQGYRALDHPDRPRHAHFPPGYPLVLAALWAATGRSVVAAHGLSIACTTAAVVLAWHWFRALYPRRIALALGLALALNGAWIRLGGEIRSEPLYLLLGQLAIVLAIRGRGRWLGVVLGAATLTRHVGIALTAAIGADLGLRGRWKAAVTALGIAVVMVAPWALWMASVGKGTQVGLVPGASLGDVIASNARFYMRRLPDQVTGPIVEVATIFRPAWARPADAWAVVATGVIGLGWVVAARSRRRRLAALVPAATLPMLLAWPFTEAGRFLVPLVPFVLIGVLEGLGALLRLARLRHPRGVASALVLAASIPYSIYALAADRPGAARRGMASFDAACGWIAGQARHPGPVLSRHPGEVWWLSGRPGLVAADEEAVGPLIERYGVAFLLLDDARFANAPESVLSRYVARHPDRVVRAWSGGGVAVFAVRSRVDGPRGRGDAPAMRGGEGKDAR